MCCFCQAGVITGPGKFQKSYLSAGDAGYAPKGSAHYIKALGNEPSYAILMFDQGQFTNIDFPVFLSQVPNQVCTASDSHLSSPHKASRDSSKISVEEELSYATCAVLREMVHRRHAVSSSRIVVSINVRP